MGLSLKECERLTGLSRSALQKAIKTGKLSASRSESGAWAVDPVELSRVYTVTPDTTSHRSENSLVPPNAEVEILKERVRGLEDLVLVLNESQQDLRTRLTNAESERTRLTHLLTHQAGEPVLGQSQTGNKWLTPILVVLSVILTLAGVWLFELNKAVG